MRIGRCAPVGRRLSWRGRVFVAAMALDAARPFCGGIFGVETGSNASTLLLYSIVVANSLLGYMNGSEKISVCFAKCVVAISLAMLAELKFFLVIFVLILVMSGIITRFSVKKISIVLFAVLLMSMSSSLYQVLFGENLSIGKFFNYLEYEHYSSAHDVGRITAIPQISQTIHTDWISRLLGLGLGNCDTSSFEVCNTTFFQEHQNMNYIWFSSACWFLETGFVGLLTYLAFFAICFVMGIKQIKHREGNLLYSQLAIIMSVICVLLTFYNASLRSEIGFLAFFVMALPLIGDKNNDVYALTTS